MAPNEAIFNPQGWEWLGGGKEERRRLGAGYWGGAHIELLAI